MINFDPSTILYFLHCLSAIMGTVMRIIPLRFKNMPFYFSFLESLFYWISIIIIFSDVYNFLLGVYKYGL